MERLRFANFRKSTVFRAYILLLLKNNLSKSINVSTRSDKGLNQLRSSNHRTQTKTDERQVRLTNPVKAVPEHKRKYSNFQNAYLFRRLKISRLLTMEDERLRKTK